MSATWDKDPQDHLPPDDERWEEGDHVRDGLGICVMCHRCTDAQCCAQAPGNACVRCDCP